MTHRCSKQASPDHGCLHTLCLLPTSSISCVQQLQLTHIAGFVAACLARLQLILPQLACWPQPTSFATLHLASVSSSSSFSNSAIQRAVWELFNGI